MTIEEYFKADKFADNAGVELIEVGAGYAKARMKITAGHLNAGGVCQGGAIFTLADFAFAVACNSHRQLTFSINSSINIFRSESEGYLYAEAREVFDHKKLSNCEVQVKNESGELVATFNGTGFRKPIELLFDDM
ncbi:PaaI family thioesterase [Paludibacter sp. 221]|uniref:PaaI family thioesterase n=1 Tax=Paludibacter sp. 221 TaxID=2302939 RepID=UPI0013D61EFA|nr:PaaI family thioesterase [Paludibacter sp. 221]NDV47328.1 PaaI family thioesterase [Paludibacter sp. 221]